LVKDINPGPGSSFPGLFTDVGGTLFFQAFGGVHGGLWKSDGTEDGTVLVKDGFGAFELTDVDGTLFFKGADAVHGLELWKSDGSAEGTILVKDIVPGRQPNGYPLGPQGPFRLTNNSGTLFFATDDGVNGMELWKSDGTAEGTVMVQDINPGSASSGPRELTSLNGILFFAATDGVAGNELWAIASP